MNSDEFPYVRPTVTDQLRSLGRFCAFLLFLPVAVAVGSLIGGCLAGLCLLATFTDRMDMD